MKLHEEGEVFAELVAVSAETIGLPQVYVEKMLGVIKDSYSEDPVPKLSDRIRHLYDICLILRHNEYRAFVASDDFKSLCDICIEDGV